MSIVVPARDAAGTLDAQLRALADQDHPGPIEVVVVDNGSTDDTADRARAWAGRLPGLRVLDASTRAGAAHARNVGVRAASSDLVLVCDADDVVDRAWARLLVAALADVDAVAGGVVGFTGPEPPVSAPAGTGAAFGTAGFGFLPALMTASAGFRRAAWAAVEGFDETLRTCEDLDFAWRLQQRGFTLRQVPEALVHHREPSAPGAVVRTWYRYGRDQPVLYRRFAAAGMPRDRPRRVLAAWARLLVGVPRLATDGDARRAWCREAGRRAGRLVGSVRARTVFL